MTTRENPNDTRTRRNDLMYTAFATESPLIEKIMRHVKAHPELRPHHVDFPDVLTLSQDDKGHFVEDLNGVVRWYIGDETLETTESFEEHCAVVNQNQHSATTLEGLIQQK